METYFKTLWQDKRPLGKAFLLDKEFYFYDSGTNKIIQCNEIEYDFINMCTSLGWEKGIPEMKKKYSFEQLEKIYSDIKEAVSTEGILLNKKGDNKFYLGKHLNFEVLSKDRLKNVTIEVTDSCNNRCLYCVHNEDFNECRNHGQQSMDLKKMKQCVDYQYNHSSQLPSIRMSFYGGEPFLEIDNIWECIQYAKKRNAKRSITFLITTNGTLLSKEWAVRLAEENVHINVSIDGPKEIHDRFRFDINGKGTFTKVINSLKLLKEAYGNNFKDYVGLLITLVPPYTQKIYAKIESLFKEYPWLNSIKREYSYVLGNSNNVCGFEQKTQCDEFLAIQEYQNLKILEQVELKQIVDNNINDILDQDLMLKAVIDRPIYRKPLATMKLNDCCVPGVDNLFIGVDGRLFLCERLDSLSPGIGNLEDGLNYENLQYYVETYAVNSQAECSKCWINQLCTGICYTSAFKKGEFDHNSKLKQCIAVRDLFKKKLKLYCRLVKDGVI